MRALFKEILKGGGTPVLQTVSGGVETILSAGNIWTSAHARRIAWAEQGAAPGTVICSSRGGFAALVDFVACSIGGFAYCPASPQAFAALRGQIEPAHGPGTARIMLIGEGENDALRAPALPRALAMLNRSAPPQLVLLAQDAPDGPARVRAYSAEALERALAALAAHLGTAMGAARLSCGSAHHERGFVCDLRLAVCNRQTIYLREAGDRAASDVIAEALALEVEDLVLPPPMIDALAIEPGSLDAATRAGMARLRLHTAGRALSDDRQAIAARLCRRVFVEPFPCGESRGEGTA